MKNYLIRLSLAILTSVVLSISFPSFSIGDFVDGGDGSEMCLQANLKFEKCPDLPDPNNICCDGIEKLGWDSENSIETLEPSSSGEVYVIGGKDSKDWKVEGKGCWTNQEYTEKEIIDTDNSITIYTDENSCGACQVTVTDKCQRQPVVEFVRVTIGEWHEIEPSSCPIRGIAGQYIIRGADAWICGFGSVSVGAVSGKYKVKQLYYSGHSLDQVVTSDPEECDELEDIQTTIQDGLDDYGYREDVVLIDPIKTLQQGVVGPTHPNKWVSNKKFHDWPWSDGDSFPYVEKHYNPDINHCTNLVYCFGLSYNCRNNNSAKAWEWVCEE